MRTSFLRSSGPRSLRPILVLTFSLLALLPVSIALALNGAWTPPKDWGATAVHMALVPGDNSPYHSRILWWQEEGSAPGAFIGGQWGWRPVTTDCATYPESAFISLDFPDPGVNIFCSGFAKLPDSRLFVAGGTESGTENGMKHTFIFTPGAGTAAGTWAQTVSMASRRWYGSVTELSDGRMLTTSGSQYGQLEIFGGRTDGAATPADSVLIRFGVVGTGVWDASVAPSGGQLWPSPRTGHTSSGVTTYTAVMYFGGRLANGKLTKELWWNYRNATEGGSDYSYTWFNKTFSTFPPDPREEHSAVMQADTMVIFGGIADTTGAGAEGPQSDVWRLRDDPSLPGFKWEHVSTNAATGPSPRFGHAAVYDVTTSRMVVFGGVDGVGLSPSDTSVWALRFSSNTSLTGIWKQATVVNPSVRPAPRYDHTMEWDRLERSYQVNGNTVSTHSGVLFGGRGAGSQRFNDVWRLILLADSTVCWQQITTAGTPPSPRSGHVGKYEAGTNRLFVFGGESPVGATDDTMYVLDLSMGTPTWANYARRGAALSGETAVFGNGAIYSKVPEIYSTDTGQWSAGSNGARLQQWYPQMFVAPNGTVFNSGPSDTTWSFDPANGVWSRLPASTTSGFLGGSAVMYVPGKVLKCGTRDTEGGPDSAVKTTKIIDVTAGTPSWQTSGNMIWGRVNMNLTLLPTGKVLVTGGTALRGNNFNTSGVRQPEIWDPAAGSGAGAWYGGTLPDTLAKPQSTRGYHSTAILLPDARVLCAGGNTDSSFQRKADIFCPPYLFDGNGDLAARPTTTTAPAAHMKWRKVFTLATSRSATIKSVCLLKPASTTHAFDMDQRFVPLTFVAATDPGRLFVTAPADSNLAPPGDYMLFMIDSVSSSAPRVPSVATWLKVDRLCGRDSCDTVRPAAVFDLSGCPVTVHGSIQLTWTDPGDDTLLSASGVATWYELRRSNASITSANWSSATLVSSGAPGPQGTTENFTDNVGQGHWYYAVKTRDDNEQWSLLSNVAIVDNAGNSMCGDGFYAGSGGGGGGSSVRRTAEGASVRQSSVSGFVENTLLNGAAEGARATDLMRLAAAPELVDGAYSVRIRQSGARAASVDAVRLVVADHSAETQPFNSGSGVLLGSRVPPLKATTAGGTDLTVVLDGSSTYNGAAGDAVTVELGADPTGTSSSALVIEAAGAASGSDPASSGILLQTPDPKVGWHTIRHLHPRREFDEIAMDSVAATTVRLLFLSDHSLRFVGRLARSSEPPTLQWTSLLSARTSLLGNTRAAIAAADTLDATLAGADTLWLRFSVPPLAEGMARDYFLAVDATQLSPRSPVLSRSSPTTAAIPIRFALRQNEPNPFSSRTTIRFDLPIGAPVRLEVFDAQGRRVQTLANRYFPAGYHALAWDHASGDGHGLGPGVYFYRVEAGPLRDRKKMVLLAR